MIASYQYDYHDRRVSKTVYGSPNVETRYSYSGANLIAEYNGSGTMQRWYVYGDRIDEPVAMFIYVTVYYFWLFR